MHVAIWNVLHDGRLIAAADTVPGNLQLLIEIKYLCGLLPTRAEHLVVTLVNCEQFQYQPYDDPVISDPRGIAALVLELLSAELVDDCLSVECSDGGCGGRLLLRYRAADASTAEGQPLTQTELESAAERYWSDWQRRHAQAGGC